MDKEIIPISKNKCCVTILIPLGFDVDNMAKKMECEQLANSITAIAKDLHIDYAVRANGNIRTAEISFTHEGRVTSEDEHKYEIKAIEFMKQIEKLDLPKPIPEPEYPSQENADENVGPALISAVLAFDEECIKYSVGIEEGPFFREYCCIPREIMQEMCKLYLKAHEQN